MITNVCAPRVQCGNGGGKRRCRYLNQPGTRVAGSQNGIDWKSPMLKAQLTFDAPIETTDMNLVFANGQWRIRVSRRDVAVVESEGAGGTVPWSVSYALSPPQAAGCLPRSAARCDSRLVAHVHS
jgi:hypothetical protein